MSTLLDYCARALASAVRRAQRDTACRRGTTLRTVGVACARLGRTPGRTLLVLPVYKGSIIFWYLLGIFYHKNTDYEPLLICVK